MGGHSASLPRKSVRWWSKARAMAISVTMSSLIARPRWRLSWPWGTSPSTRFWRDSLIRPGPVRGGTPPLTSSYGHSPGRLSRRAGILRLRSVRRVGRRPARGFPQGNRKDLAQLIHRVYREPIPHLLVQVLEVSKVFLRQHDGGNACPNSPKTLLFPPADRQHPTRQGDLSGHGNVVTRRSRGKPASQPRRHGHTRRWTILGDRPRGNVDVHVLPGKHSLGNTQVIGV